jgi:hypothetical protein
LEILTFRGGGALVGQGFGVEFILIFYRGVTASVSIMLTAIFMLNTWKK